MDKGDLVLQLRARLEALAREARHAGALAAEEAREGATSRERRVDSLVALENGNLARAQVGRAQRAERELEAVDGFCPEPLAAGAPIGLGAVVEIEAEETGEGRTLFLAPVGAGLTLEGPGGDGDFVVITPASPIGRALLGRRVGDVIDVTLRGEVREWVITWVV
jgi:transcription elongation GreA/GreB family factor